MNHLRTLATLLLLTLCQACQQQPAPPPVPNKIDSATITMQPLTDTIDEDAKQPFEYDIDTLYHGQAPGPSTGYYGEFGGDEPYWSILFQGKQLAWVDPEKGDTITEPVRFSSEANIGFVVAFHSNHLFGIVKRSVADGCGYAISDTSYLPMDIYFNAAGRTHIGCGNLKGVDLRRG
jgi:hypothetical protein